MSSGNLCFAFISTRLYVCTHSEHTLNAYTGVNCRAALRAVSSNKQMVPLCIQMVKNNTNNVSDYCIPLRWQTVWHTFESFSRQVDKQNEKSVPVIGGVAVFNQHINQPVDGQSNSVHACEWAVRNYFQAANCSLLTNHLTLIRMRVGLSALRQHISH